MNKEENQNIEELANEIAFIFVNKCNKDGIKYETIAEDLYNAGYRKQVWHKVADGDLPETDNLVLCFKRDGRGNIRYTTGYLDCNSLWLLQDGSIFPERIDVVIAWAELPKYEEE